VVGGASSVRMSIQFRYLDGGHVVILIGLKFIRSKSYAVHTVESALACDIIDHAIIRSLQYSPL